jgi:hypothetical protein
VTDPPARAGRRRATIAIALAVLLLAAAPATLLAQTSASPPFTWTVGPYVGTSQHSPVGTHWGVTPGRQHYLLGIHADVPMIERRFWTFNWAPEFVPVLVVTHNPRYATMTDGAVARIVTDGAGPVFGTAVAPFALEADIRARRTWQPYGAGALGCVWFTRQAPVLNSRAFNLTFEFGGGVRVLMNDRTWLRVGYKFHHFSNAHTAVRNPGVDAEVFFVGFERIIRK